MRNVSDKSCRENQNTHFMSNNFFKKSYLLWDNVKKYCMAWLGTDDNMAHVHRMLHIYYKHTLRICNIYSFYTATMVGWMCLNVMLYLQCLGTRQRWVIRITPQLPHQMGKRIIWSLLGTEPWFHSYPVCSLFTIQTELFQLADLDKALQYYLSQWNIALWNISKSRIQSILLW